MQQRSSQGAAAGALALAGGLVVVIGSFLSWAKASAGAFGVSAKGIDGWEGKATIVGGLLLLVGGITALSRGSGATLKRLGLIGGLGAAGVAIYTAVTAKDQVVEGASSAIARQLGIPVEQARAAVQQAIETGALKIALEIGIYLVIAGGLVGLVAGVIAFVSSEPAPAMPVAAGGAGLTGWSVPAPPPVPPPVPPATPGPGPEGGGGQGVP